MTNSTACAFVGGCVSDYVAVGITCLVFIAVCIGIVLTIINRKILELNSKKVSMLLVQAFASLIYLWGVLMSRNVLKLTRKSLWESCNIWRIWIGPFGFVLLLSCHLVRGYRLYYVFIARRLPPLRSYQLMLPLLVPWLVTAAVMQGLKVVQQDPNCTAQRNWELAISLLYLAYPGMLVFCAWKIRHVRFKFNEFRELSRGASICGLLLVAWGAITVGERSLQPKNTHFLVTSRFILIAVVNASVLFLFVIPVAKPASDLLVFRKKHRPYSTMGQALGVPHSGVVAQHPAGFDFSRPLEYLLENRNFRESYLEFANSRLAAEVVHFYIEARELSKIHVSQVVQRVYMAEHIIDKYIKSGSSMEINLSYQMRMEILNTKDLTDPDLFKRAVNEALTMMQTNLSDDYWKSTFFHELEAELEADVEAQYDDGFEEVVDVSNKRGLRKLFDQAPDNPFDQVCPFSSELCKGNSPEQRQQQQQQHRKNISITGSDKNYQADHPTSSVF